MFTVQRHAGRLMEVRAGSPMTLDQITGSDQQMAVSVREAGGRGIICADYTQLQVLAPDHTDAMIDMFRRYNDRIDYSAILVAAHSATSILQIERVTREARNPRRQCFRRAMEMRAWLQVYLTEVERTALDGFLATIDET